MIKEMEKCGCPKSCCGWILLIIGILFLLEDLGTWNFFNLNWWTVLFIILGICWLCKCKK